MSFNAKPNTDLRYERSFIFAAPYTKQFGNTNLEVIAKEIQFKQFAVVAA